MAASIYRVKNFAQRLECTETALHHVRSTLVRRARRRRDTNPRKPLSFYLEGSEPLQDTRWETLEPIVRIGPEKWVFYAVQAQRESIESSSHTLMRLKVDLKLSSIEIDPEFVVVTLESPATCQVPEEELLSIARQAWRL